MTSEELRASAQHFLRCGRDPVPCSAFGDLVNALADLTDEVKAQRERVEGLETGRLETCDAIYTASTAFPHRFCRRPKGHEGNCEYV